MKIDRREVRVDVSAHPRDGRVVPVASTVRRGHGDHKADSCSRHTPFLDAPYYRYYYSVNIMTIYKHRNGFIRIVGLVAQIATLAKVVRTSHWVRK